MGCVMLSMEDPTTRFETCTASGSVIFADAEINADSSPAGLASLTSITADICAEDVLVEVPDTNDLSVFSPDDLNLVGSISLGRPSI